MDLSKFLRAVFSPWVIFGGSLLAVLLFGSVFLLLYITRPGPAASQAPGTAVVNIIPAPTSTVALPTVSPSPTAEPTPTVPAPPPPGDVNVGDYVQITGTGGDGLRFRTEPGLGGQVVFLAIDAEVFQVTEGPENADGYTWWYLTAPYDSSKKGWAVANYLAVIQNP